MAPPFMLSDVVRFSTDGRILATDTQHVNQFDREVQPPLRLWRVLASWQNAVQQRALTAPPVEPVEKLQATGAPATSDGMACP